MKKIIYLMLVLSVIMFSFSACQNKDEISGTKMQLYYVSNSENKIEAHDYYLQATELEMQVDELMSALSINPEKLEYKAPFSYNVDLKKVNIKENRVILDFGSSYHELNDITEILFRAAVVKSLTALEGIKYVEFTVNGVSLYDNMSEQVGWMTGEQFIFNDGNEINTYEQIKIKMYFATEDGEHLATAYREKYYSTNTPVDKFVVDELIAGPSGQVPGLFASINPETKVLNVTTKDGVCYVNLDSSFLSTVNNVSLDVAVYSIVNSLAELNNINKVQILINGETPSVFTNSTFERNLDYVVTLDNKKN